MARVVTLADFRPSRRADGAPWTKARIEDADDPAGAWTAVETIDLDPVDEDPSKPALRSFTVGSDKGWLRIVFLDEEGGEDDASAIAATTGPQFRPTVPYVSAILRARTYTGTGTEEDPMSVIAGGELAGEFNENTRPSAAEVEAELIPQACTDVARRAGPVPGELLNDARQVAALGVAKGIERSYLPEQAEPGESIFQTLRLTYEEDLGVLSRNIHFWTLANRGLL